MKPIALPLLLFLFGSIGFSQHAKEGCHVYAVDTLMAERLLENLDAAKVKECEKNSVKCGIVDFPVFTPKMGEEELTTKTYKFPWSTLTITASVFFTDESLASSNGDGSATMTISLSQTPPKNVQADENSAQAEFALDIGLDAARVKRYYRVKDRQYLVGLECRLKKSDPK